MSGWQVALLAARAVLATVMPVLLAGAHRTAGASQPRLTGHLPAIRRPQRPAIAGGCPHMPVSPEVVMISIRTIHRFAWGLVGLVGALAALSAAVLAAPGYRLPPPRGSGGSTQAQTPIRTIVTSGGRGAPRFMRARRASPVRHVVVIYLENHSFDNLLGYWCDANVGRCPDGGMPASVTLSDGAVVTPGVTPDLVPAVDHTLASQVAAMNIRRGVPQMNGWQNILHGQCDAVAGYPCISGYRPAQIPNITTLASDFAISDDTFSMADSPSWGGHLYAVTSTLDGFTGDNPYSPSGVTPGPGWGCDSDKVTRWVSPGGASKTVPSCIPDPSLPVPNGGAFRPTPVQQVPTILDRLDAARLSWRIYGATKAEASGGGKHAAYLSNGYAWSICPSIAACLYTSQDKNLVPSVDFQGDALNGTLPAFSVVTPGGRTFTDSCHNSFSITACDNWVGSLVQSVEHGPDWASTAVFITWDDCGCFYDQVPPPASLNSNGQQAGPRVPVIIVSPYARPGFTDTTPTTFAGILAYTEDTFGLPALGVNDSTAYSFAQAFNYSQKPLKPVPMTHRPLPAWAKHIHLARALENDPT